MLNQVNIDGTPSNPPVHILDFADSINSQACDDACKEVFTNFYAQQMQLYETAPSSLTELLVVGTAISSNLQQLQEIHLQAAKITHIMANTLADQENGQTYLHKACLEGDKAWVEFLLSARGIDIHKVDRNGSNAFHLACQNGRSEIVELLLPEINNINAVNDIGRTALHMASLHKQTEVVKFLLQMPEIDIDLVDRNGATALDLACGDIEIELLFSLAKRENIASQ